METLQIKKNKLFLLDRDERTNEYRVLPKKKTLTMYNIKAPLWLRKVQESELQLMKWVGCGRCLCRLDGVEVDVDIAWDLLTFKKMEKIMVAVKELSELDLCYKPVAHILRGNDVIGIAFERQSGRPMEYIDRRLDGKLRVYHHLWGFNVHRGKKSEFEDRDEAIALDTMDRIFKLLREKGKNPGDDRYGNGDPLIFPYAQWGREHPLRNPVVGIIFSPPVYAMQKNTFLPPRRMEGRIRFGGPLFSDNGDSSVDNKLVYRPSTTVRKASRSPLIASSTSKRSRLDSQASSSESQVVEIDDTETIGSSDGDDETLVDEDSSISGHRRFSSVSTMTSVRSF
ncbi:hypothetical protein PQX77_009006 [Marasmius sp. AFHP31]|nr:hypothetical protein PQX77_009006 [Marasmius sp. AFHP31]